MAKLPALKPKKVINALEKAGFFIHHQRGSHVYLKHPNLPDALVVVPYHNKDLKRGTLHSIIRNSKLSVDEFLKLI